MKLVIFGLSVTSSWGNGHATLWRGLTRALAGRRHEVHFFERDVPYYASHRDIEHLDCGHLHLYPDWESARTLAEQHLSDADAGMVTSYCPDALSATELMLESRTPLKTFYDLDTPVTLSRLQSGESVDYIGPRGLSDYDLVLSYTGGKALEELRTRLGARQTAPLYGHVDPDIHRRGMRLERFRADLSYLGTFALDRQDALQRLLVEPARHLPHRRFCIAGAMYPQDFPWADNIFFVRHLPPAEHPEFYCSSRLTLNVTRRAMAYMGYCPSGRLFEAAACGAPILSDTWEGLGDFFHPGSEILVAEDTAEAIDALELPDAELRRIAEAARARTLDEHTSAVRARQLEKILEQARGSAGSAMAPVARGPKSSRARDGCDSPLFRGAARPASRVLPWGSMEV